MSKIIKDETSEGSSPIVISDKSYVTGRDNGETLAKRALTTLIEKEGKHANNTGPTAEVLRELTSEVSWWQKAKADLGITEQQDKIYLCRIISDHKTSCLVRPESAEDNVSKLPYLKFVLPGSGPDGGTTLTPGNKVKVQIDNLKTMFASPICGTIVQIIDINSQLEQDSTNCGTNVPTDGSTRSTVAQSCSGTTRSGRGRAVKMAKTKPPKPTRGKYPKSPITGLRATGNPPPPGRLGPYELPRIGRVNSGFPVRNDGVTAHKGVDFRTKVNGVVSTGASIKAALDGTAITGVVRGYGYVVAIKHTAYKADTPNSAFWTFYAHLLPAGMVRGPVKAGQEIGKSGNSSGINKFESTPHLHFEVIYDNDPSWTQVHHVISGGAVDPVNDFFFTKFEKK